jgi:hypothetical protein
MSKLALITLALLWLELSRPAFMCSKRASDTLTIWRRPIGHLSSTR